MSKNKCDQESIFGVCTLLLVLSLFGVHFGDAWDYAGDSSKFERGILAYWNLSDFKCCTALSYVWGGGGGAALFYPF